MANTSISKLVDQAVRQGLYEHGELFKCIMDELADEIAPLVAGQISQQLSALIYETPRNQLANELAIVCRNILSWIDNDRHYHDDAAEQRLSALRSTIADSVQKYIFICGEDCLTKEQAPTSGESPFADLKGCDV